MTVTRKRLARIAQLGVVVLAGLLSVMALAALASQLKGHRQFTALLERYNPPENPQHQDETQKPDDKNTNKKTEKSPQDEQADRIVKRNIFAMKKTKKFSLKLMGILGELVYFQGENKGFTVGQSHKDAKIKRIGPDWVELEFDGKEKKLYVFGEDKGGGPSKPPMPGGTAPPPASGRPSRAGGRRGRGPGRMGSGFELSPEMIERFKSMPEEMRQRALERMPAEFREKIEKEL